MALTREHTEHHPWYVPAYGTYQCRDCAQPLTLDEALEINPAII